MTVDRVNGYYGIIKSEDNARSLDHEAVAELARITRVNLQLGKAKIVHRETGRDATKEFLDSDQFKSLPKRVGVETRAKHADVLDLYNIFYRVLSMDTHGHDLTAIVDRSNLDLVIMHSQGVGALLKALTGIGRTWMDERRRIENEELRVLLGIPGSRAS